MRTVALLLCALATTLLVGCATTNDSGVRLYKKPDLTKVTPGTPVNKVGALKKPIKREVITKGELKGAEAWLYEWDAPNDEVNNKMFTSVVIKDGVVLGYVEDKPDKWRKDPKLHKAAKLQSSFEDLSSSLAQAARYQAAASMLAGYNAYNASRPRYDPVAASQNFFTYKPWENAPSTVNYGMVGEGPIGFGASRPAAVNAPSKVYSVLPNSLGMRDLGNNQPLGVVDNGKVYSVLPNSLGMRDLSKNEPIGVVDNGKVYPVLPNSLGMRDLSKIEPIGVVGQ